MNSIGSNPNKGGGGPGVLGALVAAAVILPFAWTHAEPRVSGAAVWLGWKALAPLDFLQDVKEFRYRIEFGGDPFGEPSPYGNPDAFGEPGPYGNPDAFGEPGPYGYPDPDGTAANAYADGAYGEPGPAARPVRPGAVEVLRFAGGYYGYLFLALSALMILTILRRDPGRVYRRELDMWGLLQNNAKEFPCLKPILKTGPITRQPANSGAWALAKSPLLFCAEQGLLVGESDRTWTYEELVDPETGLGLPGSPALKPDACNRMDFERATILLAPQLGDEFSGGTILDLPDWQAALAAAFLCHMHDRKRECYSILDELSGTWKPGIGDFTAAAAWPEIERYASLKCPALELHRSYVNVWFTALLREARRKGALPSSLWIWLKPTDRSLFYALNQLGGRVAWIEAAAVWSHMAIERRTGTVQRNPCLGDALKALAATLRQEGWIPPQGPDGFTEYGFFQVPIERREPLSQEELEEMAWRTAAPQTDGGRQDRGRADDRPAGRDAYARARGAPGSGPYPADPDDPDELFGLGTFDDADRAMWARDAATGLADVNRPREERPAADEHGREDPEDGEFGPEDPTDGEPDRQFDDKSGFEEQVSNSDAKLDWSLRSEECLDGFCGYSGGGESHESMTRRPADHRHEGHDREDDGYADRGERFRDGSEEAGGVTASDEAPDATAEEEAVPAGTARKKRPGRK